MQDGFPAERSAIDRSFALVRKQTDCAALYCAGKAVPARLARVFGGLIRWPFSRLARRTTREVLDGLTSNQDLKAVLTAQWGDCGAPSGEGSFAAHAIEDRRAAAHGHAAGLDAERRFPTGAGSSAVTSSITASGGASSLSAAMKRRLSRRARPAAAG